MRLACTALILTALAVPASAAGPPAHGGGGFALPIDCTLGRDCWIMNYPDMDPGPRTTDPLCGPRSNDGHKGTDIAIRDRAVMERGVAVLAVAPGIVMRVRDGMTDRAITAANRDDVTGRECGNGVVVDHGGGWVAQYCHLRRSSIGVKRGQRVAVGTRLGLVGLSGLTAFPHVHLSLRYRGKLYDPLTGASLAQGCSATPSAARTLWRKDLGIGYSPGAVYAAGFATGRVSAATVKADAASPARLRPDARALVLWAALFGVRKGDIVALTIRMPNGKTLIAQRIPIKRTQAWRLSFAGKRRPQTGWDRGVYRGTAELRRGTGAGAVVLRREVTVTLR